MGSGFIRRFGNGYSALSKICFRPSHIQALLASAPRSWFWLFCVDLYPTLTAFALPWSTTAVAILMAVWFVVLLPTINRPSFFTSLKIPSSILPILFCVLALSGMLWADSPWAIRLQGLSPVIKLLAIPFLLYHFSRSRRAHWVFIAFLASCVLLMGLSWVSYFASWEPTGVAGVPVKNYIDQSQEFSLCLFAIAPLLLKSIAENRRALSFGYSILLLSFFVTWCLWRLREPH